MLSGILFMCSSLPPRQRPKQEHVNDDSDPWAAGQPPKSVKLYEDFSFCLQMSGHKLSRTPGNLWHASHIQTVVLTIAAPPFWGLHMMDVQPSLSVWVLLGAWFTWSSFIQITRTGHPHTHTHTARMRVSVAANHIQHLLQLQALIHSEMVRVHPFGGFTIQWLRDALHSGEVKGERLCLGCSWRVSGCLLVLGSSL